MSDYKCTNPYFSHSMTKRYGYGNLITSGVYSQLPPSEQVNFTRVITESNNSYSSSDSSSWMPSQDISSSWDSGGDSDSSSSDSGSFDFGGGDSGGGGASGDW